MKYLKFLIGLALVAEIAAFTVILLGSYKNPEKLSDQIIDGDVVFGSPDMDSISLDYRMWKYVRDYAVSNERSEVYYPKGVVSLYLRGEFLSSDSLFLDSLVN